MTGKKIRSFITDYSTNRMLKEQKELYLQKDKPGYRAEEACLFNIYDQVHYQRIEGFGGAMTQASAQNLLKLDRQEQEKIMESYFDCEKGIGYSLCRTTINSCDFSSEFYSYDDTPEDWELKNFSVEHDEKDVIPMVKKALAINGELKLFSSPWSPPGWMKTNGRMDKGGYLRKECYQVWADYFVRFLQEYQKEGISVWGVTAQNEAHAEMGGESCYYTSAQEREFVRNYLKPALKKAGMDDKKVFFWDHNKERAFDRAMDMYAENLGGEAPDGMAVHWYVGDHFGALDAFHERYPDKLILGTEACVGTEPKRNYDAGEKYAHDIIGDLNHWACGWVDWNMILSNEGGPDHWREEQKVFCRKYAQQINGEYKLSEIEETFLLPCIKTGIWTGEAPIVVNHETGKIRFQSTYYYIGHFSRFIRPGAVRIASSVYTDKLETAAFLNPNGQIVAVVLNRQGEEQRMIIRYHDQIAETKIPGHSIVTYLLERAE